MRPLLAVSFVAATLFGTIGAGAREPSVRIREVTQNAEVQLDAATVRSALTSELAGVEHTVHGSKRANLSMRVTRAVAVDGHIEYVVSAVVQDARGGNVLGMLEGRAQTTRSVASSEALERTMLRDAAHGALVNLPGVLR